MGGIKRAEARATQQYFREIEKNIKQRNPYTLTMMSVKDNRDNYSNSIDVLSVHTKTIIICVPKLKIVLYRS